MEDDVFITESDILVDWEIEDNCFINNTFIGATACKKITVNLLSDNTLDLEGKTIKVYSGIKIENEIEYVLQGSFIIDKPNTEEVENKTKFVGYDFMLKFNTSYVDNNTYPVSLYNFLINLCNTIGINLENQSIVNGDYMIQKNPFTKNETNKFVLGQICQLCGGFAQITPSDELKIQNLADNQILDTLDGNIYNSFSKNKKYGKINSVTLKKTDSDEIDVNMKNQTSIDEDGLTDITIKDNYFLSTQEDMQSVIHNIYNILENIEYVPFKMEYYGFPYLELGDGVQVLDNDDIPYQSYILNYTLKYNGGFEGTLETNSLGEIEQVYSQYESPREVIKRFSRKVDEINGEVIQTIEEVSGQNQKINEIRETVDEINSKISDIADITVSKETDTGRLLFDSINQSEPIHVEIRPLGENITYLYPRNNLFPSDNLYIQLRTLRFTNTSTNEVFNYELPDDLLYYDTENYDEFVLDYGKESQTVYIIKKCEYNNLGEVVLLANAKKVEYPFPSINLTNGDYKVEVLKYDNVPYVSYLFCRLMSQNIYTDQFYTKTEVNTKISQTAQEFDVSVNQKLENYSTTSEMNAQINASANQIKSDVSQTYATKETTNTLSTRISQTAKTVEITAQDNETSAGITVKLKNEDGTEIDNETANITMSGLVKFTDLSQAGSTEINGSNIKTGTIDASKVKISNDNVILDKDGIKLNNGAKIVGNNGLMNTYIFKSEAKILGYDYHSWDNTAEKNHIFIDAYIPDNFQITKATVVLVHSPVYWSARDLNTGATTHVWGRSRNIKLYRCTNQNSRIVSAVYMGDIWADDDTSNYSEIANALGTNGYTPPAPSSSSHDAGIKTSSNIKNYLSSGRNRLKLETANSVPSTINPSSCAQQTGIVEAMIIIEGYTSY